MYIANKYVILFETTVHQSHRPRLVPSAARAPRASAKILESVAVNQAEAGNCRQTEENKPEKGR